MKNLEGDQYVIPSNVPAFLVKLWKLVEDRQYDMHISWNRVNQMFHHLNLCFGSFSRTFHLTVRLVRVLCWVISTKEGIVPRFCWKLRLKLMVFSFLLRVDLAFLSTTKRRSQERFSPNISSTITLQALFVSWTCVSILRYKCELYFRGSLSFFPYYFTPGFASPVAQQINIGKPSSQQADLLK